MITLRSRTISIVLTFMMVFTTLFGNASFAMAATTETSAEAQTTVEQTVDTHDHDAATEEGGAEDSTSVESTDPAADEASAADQTQTDATDTEVTDQAAADDQATDSTDATEPTASPEPETYNVDLYYAEDEDKNLTAPANGEIVFEYEDADGKTVEVTSKELEEAANDEDVDDGIELEEGTEVTVTFTPDEGYYTFYYMAYLAKDEDQEVKMVIDDEDNLDFEVERKATFEVGTDDIIVDIMFEEVAEEGEANEGGCEATDDSATKEEASTWAATGTWYWSGTTLYIKDGANIDVLTALKYTDGTNGIGLNPKSFAGQGKWYQSSYQMPYDAEAKYNKDVAPDSGWLLGGTTATDDAGLVEGTYKAVATHGNAAGKVASADKFGSEVSFTVKHYYAVTVSITGCDIGSVTYNGTTYKNGDTINFIKGSTAIALNSVDGYNAPTASGVGITPTSSGKLTVTYTAAEAAKRNVSLKVVGGDYGKASLSNSGEVAEGTVVTLNVTPETSDNDEYYYVESVKVGETVLSVNEQGQYTYTVGTDAVQFDVVFAAKVLASKEDVGTVGYNPNKPTSEQLDTLKQNIFDAVVDSGACIPSGINYADLTYEYHAWADIYSVSGGWDYVDALTTLGSAPSDTVTGKTERAFAYRFLNDGTNKEKVRLTWGSNPALYVEAEITLVDSRPTVTFNDVDLEFTFNEKSEVASTITPAVENAIKAEYTAVNATAATDITDKVVVTLDEDSYTKLSTTKDGEKQTLTYVAAVEGTADYQLASKPYKVTVIGEVHKPTIEIKEVKPADATGELGTVVVKQGDTVLENGKEFTAGTVSITATPTATDYYVDSVTVTKYVGGIVSGTETIKDPTYNAATHAYTGKFTAANGDYGEDKAVKYVVTVTYAKVDLALNAYAEGKEYYEVSYNGSATYADDAKTEFENAVKAAAVNIAGSIPNMNADLSEVTVSFADENQTAPKVGETNTIKLTWKPVGDQYPATVEEIPVFVKETRGAVDIVLKEGVTKTAEVEVDGAQNEANEAKIKKAVMDVIEHVTVNGVDRELNDLPTGVELTYSINYNELAQGATTEITVTISYAGNDKYTDDEETVTVPLKGKVHPATIKLVTTGNGNVTVGDLTFTENEDGEKVATTLAGELQITAAPTNTNGGYVESVTVDGNEVAGATNTNGVYTGTFTVDDGESAAAAEGAPTYVIKVTFAERSFELETDAAIDYNFYPDYYDSTLIDEFLNTSEQDTLKEDIFKALYAGDEFTFENSTVNYKDADGNWKEIDNDFAPVSDTNDENGKATVEIQIVWNGEGIYSDTAVNGTITLNEIRKPVTITGVTGLINFDKTSEVVTAIQNGVTVKMNDGTALAASAYSVTIADSVINGISTAKNMVEVPQPVAYTVEVPTTEDYIGTKTVVEKTVNAQVNAYDATLNLITVNNNDAEGTFVIENVEFNNNTATHGKGTLTFTATPTGFNNNTGNFVDSVVVTTGKDEVVVDADYIGNGVYKGTFDIVNGTEADPSEYTITVTFDKRQINKKELEEGKVYEAFFNDSNEYTGEYATAFQKAVYEAVVGSSTPAGITFNDVTVDFASETQTKPVVDTANSMTIYWPASTDGKYPAVTITESVTVTDSRSKAVITYTDPATPVEVDGTNTFEEKVKEAINVGVSEGAATPNIVITGTAPKQGDKATVSVKVTVAENDYYLEADAVEFDFEVIGKIHPATIKLVTEGSGNVTVGNLTFNDGVATTNTADLDITATAKAGGGFVKSVTVETAEIKDVTNVNGVYNGTISVVDGTGSVAEEGAPTYVITVKFLERTLVLKDATMSYNFYENYYDDKQASLKENIFSSVYDEENSDVLTYYEGLTINYKDAEGNWVEIDENFAPVSDTNDENGKAVVDIQIVWAASEESMTEVVDEAKITLTESRNAVVVNTDSVADFAFDETTEIIPAIKEKVVVTDDGTEVAADKFTVSVAEDVLESLDLTKAKAGEDQEVTYTVTVPSTTDYIGTITDVTDTVNVKTKTYDATLNLVVVNQDGGKGTFAIEGVEFNEDNSATHAAGTMTFTATPTGFNNNTGNYVESVTVKTDEKEVTVDAEYITDGVYTGTFDIINGTKGYDSEYTVTVTFGKRQVVANNSTEEISWNFATDYAALSDDDRTEFLRLVFDKYVDKSNGIKFNEVTMSPMDAMFNDIDYIYDTNNFFRVTWEGDGAKYPTVDGYVTSHLKESRTASAINANAVTTPVVVDGSYDGVIEAVQAAGVTSQSGGELTYVILEEESTGIPKQGETGTAKVRINVAATDKYLGNYISVDVPIIGKVYPAIVKITNSTGGTAKVTHSYTKDGETISTVLATGAQVVSGALAIEGTPNANSAYFVEAITVNGSELTVTPTKDGNLTCVAVKTIADGTGTLASAKNPIYNVNVTFAQRTIARTSKDTLYINGYDFDSKKASYLSEVTADNFVDFNACVGGTANTGNVKVRMYHNNTIGADTYDTISDIAASVNAWYGVGIFDGADEASSKTLQIEWTGDGERYPTVVLSGINVAIKESRQTPTLTNIPTSVEFDASTEEILTAVKNSVKATADGKTLEGLEITWKDETRPATNKDGEPQTATFVANVPASKDSLALNNKAFTVNVVGKVHPATVTVSDTQNGTVTITGGNKSDDGDNLYENGDVTFNATPDAGYHVESVKVVKTVTNADGTTTTEEVKDVTDLTKYTNFVYKDKFTVELGDYGIDKNYQIVVTFAKRTITVNDPIGQVRYNEKKVDTTGYLDTVLNNVYNAIVATGTTPSDAQTETVINGDWGLGNKSFTVTWKESARYPAVSVTKTVELTEARQKAPIDGENATYETSDLVTFNKILELAAVDTPDDGATPVITVTDANGNVVDADEDVATPVQGASHVYKASVSVAENDEYFANTAEFTVIVKGIVKQPVVNYEVVNAASNTTTVKFIKTGDTASVDVETGNTYAAGTLAITAAPTGTYFVDTVKVNKDTINSGQNTLNYEGTTEIKDGTGSAVTTDAPEYNVVVTYTAKALAKKSTIDSVGWNPTTNASGQLEQLKQNIFKAVVDSDACIPEGITYDQITYQFKPVKKVSFIGDDTVPTDLTGDTSNAYYFGERFGTDGATEHVYLTWNASGKYPASKTIEADVTLVDSRALAGLTNGDVTVEQPYESVQSLTATLEAMIEADKTINPNGLDVTISFDETTLPNKALTTGEIAVNVTFAGNADYQPGSCTVTATVTPQASKCYVYSVTNDSGTIKIGDATVGPEVATAINGNSTITMTVTPNSGMIPTGVTVIAKAIDADGKEATTGTAVATNVTINNRVATATFKSDGLTGTVNYYVSVTYENVQIVLNDGQHIEYNYAQTDAGGNLTTTPDELEALVYDAVYNKDATNPDELAELVKAGADGVEIQYVYATESDIRKVLSENQGLIPSWLDLEGVVDLLTKNPLWATIGEGAPSTSFDWLNNIINEVTHNFGESGSETVRIVYNDSKYGEVISNEITLKVFDSRYNVGITTVTELDGEENVAPENSYYTISPDGRDMPDENGDMSIEYMENTDYTITVDPGNKDIDTVIGNDDSIRYYVDSIVVTDSKGNVVADTVTFAEKSLDDPQASVTFRTSREEDYTITVKYGTLKITAVSTVETLNMYKAGNTYPAKVPTVEEIYTAVLDENKTCEMLQKYDAETITVEYSTDGQNYTAYSEAGIASIADGTTIDVKLTYTPVDDKSLQYSTVTTTGKVTLKDQRTATEIEAAKPATPVEYLEQEVLIQNLMEKMGPKVLNATNGEAVEITDKNFTVTVSNAVEKDGQWYIDVTLSYDGSADYKPVSKTIESVPITDVPDNSSVTVKSVMDDGTAADHGTVTFDKNTDTDGTITIDKILGNTAYKLAVDPDDNYAVHSITIKKTPKEAESDGTQTAEEGSAEEDPDSAEAVSVTLFGDEREMPAGFEELDGTYIKFNELTGEVIYTDKNGITASGLYINEKCDYEITINYVKPEFALKDELKFNYKTGWDDAITEADKIEILDAIVDGNATKPGLYLDTEKDSTDNYKIRDQFAEDPDRLTMEYQAAPARTVTIPVDLSIDLGMGIEIPIETDVPVDLEEIWLPIGTDIPEGSNDINEIINSFDWEQVVADVVGQFDTSDILGLVTNMDALKAALNEAIASVLAGNEKLYYYGAHSFGDNGHGSAELIRFSYLDDQYLIPQVTAGDEESGVKVEINDDRTETQLNINETVTVQYGLFDKDKIIELLKVEGSESMVEFVAEDGTVVPVTGLNADNFTIKAFPKDVKDLDVDTYEFTVRYHGSETTRPVEGTFTLDVQKAPVEVLVESGVYRYGEIPEATVTTDPEGVEMIKFAAGVNVSKTYNGGVDGVTSLDIHLDVDGTLGKLLAGTYDLSEFENILNTLVGSDLLGSLGIDSESLGQVMDIITQLTNATDAVTVTIKVNQGQPSDVGVYVIGGVTVDGNYEQAYNVGYLVIHPNGYKAELDWNIHDDNYLITLPHILNKEYDLGAHVTDVLEGNIADAQETVAHLFIGIDTDGEIVIERAMDSDVVDPDTAAPITKCGAYTQISYMQNWGNTMYYADPIIRAYAVVPELATVTFEDDNPDRQFVFDNEPHEMKATAVDMAGEPLPQENLTIRYIGYDANDIVIYNSTEPPTNVGAYTVIATYIDTETSTYGMAIGAMVIKPAEVTIDVADRVMVYDEFAADPTDGVTITESVETDDCKYITMIAGVDASGDFISDGLNAFTGMANIDFPTRIDNVLKEILPEAYTAEGVSVNEIVAAADEIGARMEALGFDAEAVDIVINFIKQLPDTFLGDEKITFHEFKDAAPENMGLYIIGAVTCDPNYKLDSDFGYLLLTPDGHEAELDWNIHDDNMIITNTLIKQGVYDMGSHVVPTDEMPVDSEEYGIATGLMNDLIIGVDIEGNLIKTNSAEFKDTVEVGAYTQVAYILDTGNELYYAKPISRAFIVVAELADVVWEDDNADRRFTYTGEPQGMTAEVFTIENEDAEKVQITDPDKLAKNLKYRYIGYDAKGIEIYNSTTPPTNVGAYTVIATYADKEADIYGMAMGAMTIEFAESSITVDNYKGTYNEDFTFDQMIHTEAGPTVVTDEKPEYVSVVAGLKGQGTLTIDGVNYVDGVINIDLPDWLQKHVQEYMPEGYETGITMPELTELFDYLETEILPQYVGGILEEYDIGYELVSVLMDMVEEMAQGQVDIKITFAETEDIKPVNVGVYLVGGMVFDANYWYSVDTGTAIVLPEVKNAVIAYNDTFTKIKLDEVEKLVEQADDYYGSAWAKKLSANAYEITADGTQGETLNRDWIMYFYYGTDLEGNTYASTEPPTAVGTYTEIAVLLQLTDGKAYYAEPLARVFEIERLDPELDMTATDKTYDGEAADYKILVDDGEDLTDAEKALADIIITHIDIKEINDNEEELFTVTYEKQLENGNFAAIEGAPTDVGVYNAVVTFAGTKRFAPVKEQKIEFEIKQREVTVELGEYAINCNGKLPEFEWTYADGSLEYVAGELPITITTELAAEGPYEAGEYKVTGTITEDPNYIFNVVDGTVTVSHIWDEDFTIDEYETCTTDGSKSKHCSGCDAKTEATVIPATGHAYGDWTVTKAATCTEKGEQQQYCENKDHDGNVCGHTVTESIAALGHDLKTTEAKAPTCTEIGWNEYVTCQRDDCGHTTYVEIPAKGHTLTKVGKVEATCTEDGHNAYEYCTVCEYTTYTKLAKLGHDMVTDAAVAPTCTTTGLTEGKHCSRCDDEVVAQQIVPALNHVDPETGESTIVVQDAVAATCTERGLTAGEYCTMCDYKVEQTPTALAAHSYVDRKDVAPTCTEAGQTGGTYCEVCGIEGDAPTVVPATNHEGTLKQVEAVAPTCTEIGWDAYEYCTACDYTTYAEKTALGHDIVVDEAVDATCTTDGLTEGKHCSRCDDETVAQKVVPATGHTIKTNEAVAPTCTEAGLTEGEYCTACDYKIAQKVVPALGHTIVKDAAVAPTCTETGLTAGEHCSVCGMILTPQTEVKATGHSYGEWETKLAPTCTTEGQKVHVCTVCGDTEKAAIEMIDHEYISNVIIEGDCTTEHVTADVCKFCGDEKNKVTTAAKGHTLNKVVAKAPTCTEIGWEAYEECEVCDYTTYTERPALGHDIVIDEAVDATCTEAGLTEGKHCSRCDDETVAQKEVPATGHTLVRDAAVAATCTTAGLTAGTHCDVCGTVTEAQKVIDATGHDMGEWTVVTPAKCETAGLETRECGNDNCDYAEHRGIAATGHKYEWKYTSGDCTTGGLKHEQCTVKDCGDIRNITVEKPAGHKFGEYISNHDATCTEDGTKTRFCANCEVTETVTDKDTATGHAFTKYIDNGDATCLKAGTATAKCDNGCGATDTKETTKADHTIVTEKAVTATCTTDGRTASEYCEECGKVIKESEVIPAKGHTVVTDEAVAPTCEKAGLTEGSHCSVCEVYFVKQEKVPATGHQFDEYTSNNDATCTKEGTKTAKCNACDATDTVADKGSAKGHTYKKDANGKIIYTTVKEATCTEDGKKVAKCTECGGAEIEKIIPATGHKVVKDAAVAATCDKAGLTEGTHCSECGTVLKAQKEVPALGHDFAEYTSNGDATCITDGTKTSECANGCGETDTIKDKGSAKGHKYQKDEEGGWIYKVVTEPTCTETGKKVVECTECGEIKFSMITAATGHDIVIDPAVAPTETETGLTEGSHCGTCGAVIKAQEVVPALGKPAVHEHTVVIDAAVAPTCTETGLTEGSHCSECGEVIKAQETVPALGHKYGEEKYQKPTATADGGWYKECENCGDKQWTKVQTWAQYVKAGVNATTIKATAKASVKTETIKVTWTKSAGFAVTHYNVYRSKTGKDGSFKKIGQTTKKTYTDKTAKPGTKYYYRVRGVRVLDGKSYLTQLSNKPYAKIKKVTAQYVKESKMYITTYHATRGVKVTWTNPRIKVDGYEVWTSNKMNGKYKKLKTVKGNVYQMTHKNLKLQSRHFYKVRGYKIVGGKKVYTKWSAKGYRYVLNAKDTKIANAINGTHSIKAAKAKKVDNGIKITWTKTDKNVKVYKYRVYRSTSKNGTYKLIGSTKNKYYVDKSSLKKGKRYYYKIQGYRYFGKALAKTKLSNVVSAVK